MAVVTAIHVDSRGKISHDVFSKIAKEIELPNCGRSYGFHFPHAKFQKVHFILFIFLHLPFILALFDCITRGYGMGTCPSSFDPPRA